MLNYSKKFLQFRRFYHSYNHDYNHHNFILNNVTNLKKDPLYFGKIPVQNQSEVLKLMPHRFFSIQNLHQLTNISIPVKLFQQYFGHIPMYYMKCDNQEIITWMPEKLLETDQWCYTRVIYPISYIDNDDIITIRKNCIDTKSYNIKSINMLNYFYLVGL